MTDDDAISQWARATDPARDPITGEEVRVAADQGPLSLPASTSDGPRRVRARRLLTAAAVLVAVGVAGSLAHLARDNQTVNLESGDRAAGTESTNEGTIRVQLEPVAGPFIEGFEIGLRFETADGTVIASTLWTDFVRSTGAEDFSAYYDGILQQTVPSGTITVLAEVDIGAGPPPTPPDLTGDLACQLTVDIAAGESIDIGVLFDDSDGDCLRLMGKPPGTSQSPSVPTTTALAQDGSCAGQMFPSLTDLEADDVLSAQSFSGTTAIRIQVPPNDPAVAADRSWITIEVGIPIGPLPTVGQDARDVEVATSTSTVTAALTTRDDVGGEGDDEHVLQQLVWDQGDGRVTVQALNVDLDRILERLRHLEIVDRDRFVQFLRTNGLDSTCSQ